MQETVAKVVRTQLNAKIAELETQLDADVIAAFGPILAGTERNLRHAVESLMEKRPRVAILLETLGGIVEVVERMVEILRHNYKEVVFYVPDMAMSAGTVFAMVGDAIFMNYFSRLGPIDPQIVKDDKLVPAMSYLAQFDRFRAKSANGDLTEAELALLMKLDLAELHQYEQARNLTVNLLRKWLATYKFKNWTMTTSRKLPVNDKMKEERAHEIATALSNNEQWHSHQRGISMNTLRQELNLQIDDFDKNPKLGTLLRSYSDLLRDYIARENATNFMVMHTRNYL